MLAYSLVMKWCSAPFRRGVHKLKRSNFGEYDNMTVRNAIADPDGIAVCMYLTKPGTKAEGSYQEIHLLKLLSPPEDIAKVFYDRPVFLPKFRQFTHLVFDRVQSTSVIHCSTLEPRYDTTSLCSHTRSLVNSREATGVVSGRSVARAKSAGSTEV